MLIEPARPADVASIVAIHRDALRDDLLPSLGPVFLHDFYAWAITRSEQHLAVRVTVTASRDSVSCPCVRSPSRKCCDQSIWGVLPESGSCVPAMSSPPSSR